MDKLVEEIILVDKQAKKIIDDAVKYKDEIIENSAKEKDEVILEQRKKFDEKMQQMATEMQNEAKAEAEKEQALLQDKMDSLKKRFDENKDSWKNDILKNIVG